MTWLKKPSGYMSQMQAATTPIPPHLGELGCLWIAEDGSVWESRPAVIGGRGVEWVRCHKNRAEMLKAKYA